MYLARYYLDREKWIPAMNRFKKITTDYDTTIYIEEALYRLVELNYKLGLIEEANKSLDPKKHKDALLKLQARVYKDQPYVFLFASKQKIAIHKRFDNRNMYTERPGVILNNLKIIQTPGGPER